MTWKPMPFSLIVWPSGFWLPNRFVDHGLPEHDDAGVLRLLLRCDERPRLDRGLASLLVGRRRADELARRVARGAEGRGDAPVHDRRHRLDVRRRVLILERLDVLRRELREGALRSRPSRGRSRSRRHDRDDVRPESLDPLLHRGRRPVADRDEDDHRGDADRDAEHRQHRAQPVREDALYRHPECFRVSGSTRSVTTVVRRRRTSMRPSAMWTTRFAYAATLGLVGDHHDRPAARR